MLQIWEALIFASMEVENNDFIDSLPAERLAVLAKAF